VTTFYSTAAAVRTATGIGPDDLALDSDAALDAFIESLLLEATDLMDKVMHQSYLATTIPAGLNGIARDVCADALRVMVQTRQTPVVRIDDFAVRTVSSVTLSKDAKERLQLYALGSGATSVEVSDDFLAPLQDTFTAADLDTDTVF
jgi:hypothetical protein